MPRPRYDWSLAFLKGLKAAMKAGTSGGLITGAITRQWALMVTVSVAIAFFSGLSADLDGYLAEVKLWDTANGTPPPGVT